MRLSLARLVTSPSKGEKGKFFLGPATFRAQMSLKKYKVH